MKLIEEMEDLEAREFDYNKILDFIELTYVGGRINSFHISVHNLLRAISLMNNTTYEEELAKFEKVAGRDISDLEKNQFNEYEIIE